MSKSNGRNREYNVTFQEKNPLEQGRPRSEENKEAQQYKGGSSRGKGGKAPIRWPLINSIKTGVRYLFSMADEALLAAVFVLPIWGIAQAMKVATVTLPTNFGVLWAIAFVMFLLQNNLFRRGG
jgi:hypothetical protein